MAEVNEKLRIYYFPKDESIHVVGVTDIQVSKSGGHRLTNKLGQLWYIPTGWLAIQIDSDNGWEV